MFELNDDFLAEVGLADMPDADRAEFLQHVYETLELRVGSTLSEGLSDAQLAEFEAIIDRDAVRVIEWVEEFAADFEEDPLYRRIADALGGREDSAGLLCEYVATKWLEVNRPDYRAIVAVEFEIVRAEIRSSAGDILAACGVR